MCRTGASARRRAGLEPIHRPFGTRASMRKRSNVATAIDLRQRPSPLRRPGQQAGVFAGRPGASTSRQGLFMPHVSERRQSVNVAERRQMARRSALVRPVSGDAPARARPTVLVSRGQAPVKAAGAPSSCALTRVLAHEDSSIISRALDPGSVRCCRVFLAAWGGQHEAPRRVAAPTLRLP
jgi:hypothetical protein